MRRGHSSPHHGFQPRHAIAAVELALTAPLLALLVVGVLEVARMVQINQIVSNAAREGARNASMGTTTYANVQTVVADYLTNAGITNQSGLSVSVYDVTQGNSGPSFNPSSAIYLDQLQVVVTLPYSNVQLIPMNILPSSAQQIIGQATWFSNQDQSYPATITPPSGS